jgi:hypothetical protein
MSRKGYKPEQIISMLREADVELSRGRKWVGSVESLALRSRLITGGAESLAGRRFRRPGVLRNLRGRTLVLKEDNPTSLPKREGAIKISMFFLCGGGAL